MEEGRDTGRRNPGELILQPRPAVRSLLRIHQPKETRMCRHWFGFLSCVLVVSCLSPAARAADAKPDDEGFIRDWLMLAPFTIPESGGADEIDKKQIADEGA